MGLYDRDYSREEEPRSGLPSFGQRSVVVNLILINVAVHLLDLLFMQRTPDGDRHVLSDLGCAASTSLFYPWEWWRFLTSGFLHDPKHVQHILFNMIGLFVFGRDLEQVYGRREFLRIYLACVFVASFGWSAVELLRGHRDSSLIGASGGVAGMCVLFAMNFPHRQILLFLVLPVPAWVVALLMVVMNILGDRQAGTNVAYSAHLSGAAFAFVYQSLHWNLGSLWPRRLSWKRLRARRPRLKVHEPRDDDQDLSTQADRILEKIHQTGEASLTAAERATMVEYSRSLKRRRE